MERIRREGNGCVCVLGRVQKSIKNDKIDGTLEKRQERAPF